MARISRQELKSDEFVSGLDAAYEFFLENEKTLIVVAVVVAVIALCAWGLWSWNSHRNQAAAQMLAAGLDTFHDPLQGPTTPPGTPAYPTQTARAQAAEQQFSALVNSYGSTSAGRLGRYYLGLAQLDAGDVAAAEKTLQAAAADSDATVSGLAKNALANLYLRQNQDAKAVALLQQLAAQNSLLLPHAVVWMELADAERMTNPAEAATYYRRLEAEYPNTETADQAGKMLATLNPPGH